MQSLNSWIHSYLTVSDASLLPYFVATQFKEERRSKYIAICYFAEKKTQFSINSNKIKIHDICTNTCDMFSLMSGSCHLDRESNDEFSVECLF